MKRTKIALAALLLTIAAVTALVVATAGSAKRSDVFKVAWIYVGPHNDGGWSQAHDAGRLYVQKALGSKVQTTYKENIAVGSQLKQTVASLVQQGYKMIFGTSYGFFDKKLAAKYPDVKFEQATGTELAPNLAEYVGHGNVRTFVRMMNTKARALGLTHTHFVNPDGLDAPGHFSSADDVTKLARVAMRTAVVRSIVM